MPGSPSERALDASVPLRESGEVIGCVSNFPNRVVQKLAIILRERDVTGQGERCIQVPPRLGKALPNLLWLRVTHHASHPTATEALA